MSSETVFRVGPQDTKAPPARGRDPVACYDCHSLKWVEDWRWDWTGSGNREPQKITILICAGCGRQRRPR